jgi:hypothetical protein
LKEFFSQLKRAADAESARGASPPPDEHEDHLRAMLREKPAAPRPTGPKTVKFGARRHPTR